MPNGHDKNFARLCGAVDGFRLRYGALPTILYAPRIIIEDLQHILSPEGFRQLVSKLQIVEDEEATVRVEDEAGRQYDYGKEGFPDQEPDIHAQDWLRAEYRRPSPEEIRILHERLEELRRQFPGMNVWIDPY